MAKKRKIYCTGEGHEEHPKSILIVGDDDISIYCSKHGWIRFEFFRMGDKISFENANVVAKFGKKGEFINADTMPIISVKT